MSREWHILLQGIVGSTAYGLADADSDVDRLGVAAAPTAAFHGLHPPQGSRVSTKPDSTLHEAGRYVKLALSVNPTVTELLWLESYERISPLGQELIELRSKFLSARRVRSSYLGYATQQFTKLRNRGDGSFSADTRKRTAKHARHLARLCDQGYQLYATGSLRIRVDNPQFYRGVGERVADGDLDAAAALMCTAELNFDETTSPLPDEPDEAAVEAWLLRVRRHYFDHDREALSCAP